MQTFQVERALPHPAVQTVIDELAHDPLRHVVVLKQLLAYPEHVRVHRAAGAQGTATLVVLDVSASPYDRLTYPKAAVAAFISSDHPDLTASRLSHLPAPGDEALRLFETQGHDRAWLPPCWRAARSSPAWLERGGETRAACIAFENHGPAWEVGGVVTAPRYQVEEHNTASIALARSAGLVPFLTIVHYAHAC